MQRRAAVLLFFPLAIAVACTAPAANEAANQAAPDPAAVRQAIESANMQFATALKAGDVEALVGFYDPEGMFMPANTPGASGSAAIREALTGLLSAITVTEFTLTTQDVQLAGNLAIETGAYTMTSQPKDGSAPASTDTGKFVVVWRQQADGSWKAFRDIFNSDMPLPTAAH